MEEIAKYFDGEDAVDVRDVANADLKEQGLVRPEGVVQQVDREK